ncbi:MAG: nucleotidyltransferase domain-containing protein [Bacteroidales bacterium]|jgi:predicted nucleotidyltransferase|nr:nucleotidyltransferase domain-containing protein [Bacteroidales bacterium]
MLSKNDILSKLHELKPILNRDYSVREIGLFGSLADGSNDDNSDIDLII